MRTLVVAALFVLAACAPLGTKGTMPPPGPDGQVDPAQAPDFIAVAAGDGVVGYVDQAYLLGAGATTEAPWPVVGEDLRTVIGHLHAGRGFVPLGVDPNDVPLRPVGQGPSAVPGVDDGADIAILVRNASPTTAWVALFAGDVAAGPSIGFDDTGVGCLPVVTGSRVVLMDGDPQLSGTAPLRVLHIQADVPDVPTLWVDIAPDGRVTSDQGTPAWWTDETTPC